MTKTRSGGPVRKLLTRVLAAGALLCLYTFSTGVVMTTGVTSAEAQRGRGRGRGWVGPAIGLGIGAAIVGGAIAAEESRRRENAVEYCFRKYGDRFDPESMTVEGRRGRFPCP